MTRSALSLLVLAACGTPGAVAPAPAPDHVEGHLADGRHVRLALAGARIASVAATAETDAWLWPPIVDSHVHLAFWPVGERLAAAGVAVAVDLAAPEVAEPGGAGPHLIASGPMLTRGGGYPLSSWGAGGYGIGCDDAPCVTAAVDRLAARGARVIKLALDDDGLAPALAPVAVEAAHARGMRVAVHALSDASAALAAMAGADLLAHTPVEPLAEATVAAWRGRAVISTLAAFGGGAAAVDNLRRLAAAGATVLYGTDLGNTRDAGPSADEIALLAAAGLDDAAITTAMTTAPLAYWDLPLGALAPGAEATLLVLDRDPRTDARALAAPRAVWLRGGQLR